MVASHRPLPDTSNTTLRLHTPQTSSAQQLIRCWNCEESVHRLSDACPYCNKPLHVFHISPEDKVEAALYSPNAITASLTAPFATPFAAPIADHNVSDEHHAHTDSSPIFSILISTAAFSCAGILFLLATLIWIFGDGVNFTIQWPQDTWRSFSALGLVLLVAGSYFLPKNE